MAEATDVTSNVERFAGGVFLTGGVVYAFGTSGADTITVASQPDGLLVSVDTVSGPPGTRTFNSSSVNAVHARGNEGDDTIGASALTGVPLVAFGGAGTNTLTGGHAADNLYGGGDDTITGGARTTGTGSDSLTWISSGLSADYYDVLATWNSASTYGTGAFSFSDGSTSRGSSVNVDETSAPSTSGGGETVGGVAYQKLARVLVTSGSLQVNATSSGNLVSNDILLVADDEAPTAAADSYSTNEDTPLSGTSVLSNDTDSDGDNLTAALVGNATHGSVVLNADGTFTYTPAANYYGSDSFTYSASDGRNIVNNDGLAHGRSRQRSTHGHRCNDHHARKRELHVQDGRFRLQ